MTFQWYLPSLFGDISLKALDKQSTEVNFKGLSPQEKIALQVLLRKAAAPGVLSAAPWASPETLSKVKLDDQTEQTFILNAGIVAVQKVLSKPLKPMRKQLSAVRFSDGKLEEITSANIGLILVEVAGEETPHKERAEKAVTVAQPVIGCPQPDFDEAEVRATRVLEAFLSPEQLEDFRRLQQFVVQGADSGHHYLLTSRHAPKQRFKIESCRTVHDLDEAYDLCVHDWEVPAAEELLGMALHLQLPEHERYVRSLPAFV